MHATGQLSALGLKRFYQDGITKGLSPVMADKLRKLLFTLETAEALDQLARFPGWKLHPLKGELQGFWSRTVTGNMRLIFHFDETANTLKDIDLLDYH